jgi:hypothetical protein
MRLNGVVPGDHFDHLVDLHGDAAATVRAEWRADEEEWTAAAVAQWSHGRTLLERVRHHMHRGDTLDVELGTTRVIGRVVAVGADVFAVDSVGGRVDLHAPSHAPIACRVLHPAPSGGNRGLDVPSFRARLLELERDETVIDLGITIWSGSCRGRLTVGRDHVVVVDDDCVDTMVALSAVQSVRVVDPT